MSRNYSVATLAQVRQSTRRTVAPVDDFLHLNFDQPKQLNSYNISIILVAHKIFHK
ncbi:MAG: hypothetical protein LBT09_00920 [Planctomycetaceae bacterium]|nr:hypothetical protein [Planctomycetaceae bacterium]